MAENSKIEWTHHTDNLWWGCTEVHAGCDNCYARVLSHRYNREVWGNDVPRLLVSGVWYDLARQQRKAKEAGEVHRVFVGSMMDIFEKPMPVVNQKGDLLTGFYIPNVGFIGDKNKDNATLTTGHLRDKLFEQISDGLYPNLMFLMLTKRPSNINKMIPAAWLDGAPVNVMFGTSPVNQETAEKLIPQLLQVNGKRFLSVEPQLGPIDLTFIDADRGGNKEWCMINCLTGEQTDMARPCRQVPVIHWVINGGESGPKRRPFNAAWARKLRDDCAKSGTPFFMKQIDKVLPIPADLMIRQFPK